MNQERHCAEGAAELVRVSMIWVTIGEFVVAEGAVVGLEDGAEEERVDAGELLRCARLRRA